jgi:hypothetical protein
MGCLVFIFVAFAWIIAACASILASACLIWLLWLLGQFLLSGLIN